MLVMSEAVKVQQVKTVLMVAPGIPGAKGEPGENGAQWHTGVGAPEVSLGNAGDLYMDVANALLPIFQKGRS